jgi:PAS domain S-box-containing protein
MKDQMKSKKQLIEELEALRRQSDQLKQEGEKNQSASHEWDDIFQAIGHPAIILDTHHTILSANKATVKAAGAVYPQKLIGRKCYEIFHKAGEPPQGCPLVKMLSSGEFEEGDMEVEALGAICDVSCTPVFDEKGNLQKVIHITTDITDRKREGAMLQNSKAFLDNIIEQSPYSMWISDEKGTMIRMNPACRKLLRIKDEDVVGKYNVLKDNIVEEQGRMLLVKQVFEQGKTVRFNLEYDSSKLLDLALKDTVSVVLDVTIFPIQDANGRVTNAVIQHIDITEQKLAEESLRESEERYRSLIENQTELISRFRPDGTFVFVNDVYCKFFGKTKDELIGQKWLPFPLDEDLTLIQEKLLTLSPTNPTVVIENRVVSSKGEIHWMQFVNKGFFNLYGELLEIQSVGRDITERKQAEEDRDRILNMSYDLICIAGQDGYFKYVNPAWEKTLGYSQKELLARPFLDFIHPDDHQKNDKEVANLAAGKKTLDFQNRYIHKDGSIRTISWTATPLPEKKVFYCIGRDITEHKEFEEALLASEAELHDHYFTQTTINMMLSESLQNIPLEMILQKALNMILSIPWLAFEAKGSIHLVEGEPAELSMKARYNLPEELEKSCAHVPFGRCLCGRAALTQNIEFADHIDERHEICYEGMQPHGHYIVPILYGGRTLGVIDIYLLEGHSRETKEEEFLLTVADTLAGIIVRRQAEDEKEKLHAQLLQAQKMEAVGQLAGGVAHDFNNILSAMIGYGHLLKMKLKEDDPLRSYADHILSLSDKAANLTKSLLAFSRKQIMDPRPVDLNEIIKRIDHLLTRIIGEDIQLQTMLSENDLVVMADPGQVEQVLMNLAANARDAMPEGGLLTIETEIVFIDSEFIREHGFGKEGPHALISVTDTGAGMDRETSEKIFEPFFTTKEVGKGTGLGLAMAYGIIKQHEGHINVYSEPGIGSTFRIYLPLIEAQVEEIKHEERIPSNLAGTETVLLAEDETAVRELTQHLLEDSGYQVITAKNGQDAINEFMEYKNKIQLLLLDVVMPNKNGREVYEEIKQIKPDIRVLFMSGYPADVIHKQGIIEKGFPYIEKPVSPAKLLKKIREVLDK